MTPTDFSQYQFEKRDLTNSFQNKEVLRIAEQLYSENNADILKIENDLFRDSNFVGSTSPIILEAIKCAASKKHLSSCSKPVYLSVVFAMYNEVERLSTKDISIHGEDSLREKVKQLEWLSEGFEDLFNWEIIAVDDGCPSTPSSFEVASNIKDEEGWENVRILKLKDAIETLAVCPGFMDLETTDDSRKGGAISYGLWEAQNSSVPEGAEHVLIYTDSDLSSNLGQCGSLIHPIVELGKTSAIAHRYGIEKSVLVKERQITTEPESTRLQPGKLIILLRHYARISMLPLLEHLQDTQAGFKAFKASEVKNVLLFMEFMNETFDVELLLRFISNYGKESVVSVPILFTEDLAMSNFPANSVNSGHLEMFKQIVYIYDKIGSKLHSINNDRVRFWRRLSYEQLNNLISHFSKNPPQNLDDMLFNFRWEMKDLRSFSQAS